MIAPELLLKVLIRCLLILLLLAIIVPICQRIEIKSQVMSLAEGSIEMTPEEFLRMRNAKFGGRSGRLISSQFNFAGVYILRNKTKNMYYVGQGKQVLDRVYTHLSGRGNGDVYADYKYGDQFTIKMIALSNSGFSSLNELERKTIMTYNSYSRGYNKTRGNR